jgi:hypothetical protein
MATHYTYLTVEERVTLMIMRLRGSSLRFIAHVLGRQPSMLSRKVRRQAQPGRPTIREPPQPFEVFRMQPYVGMRIGLTMRGQLGRSHI